MADIAFLLLIFFLAATTMDSDTGLMRQLPAIPDPNVPQDINKINDRNILEVKVNKDNLLLVEGQLTEFSQLREIAHDFILNANDEPNMPEKEIINIAYFGDVPVTKAVISLQNDIGTKYGVYIAVQNELIAARTELRDEILDISYLLEGVIHLYLGFSTIERLEGFERLAYVYEAGERFLLKDLAFRGIGYPDGDHDVGFPHGGYGHEEEEYHEDDVRQ
jgi:biopolymer transport protein ExbD